MPIGDITTKGKEVKLWGTTRIEGEIGANEECCHWVNYLRSQQQEKIQMEHECMNSHQNPIDTWTSREQWEIFI